MIGSFFMSEKEFYEKIEEYKIPEQRYSVDCLKEDAQHLLDVTKVDKYELFGEKISSTCIREALKVGNIEKINTRYNTVSTLLEEFILSEEFRIKKLEYMNVRN